VGGSVGFHFYALLLPGNDNIVDIPANTGDSAEVTHGGVIEVATPLLVCLNGAVPAIGAHRIDEPTVLLLGVICVFYLDVG
jgi:hypothetical protein